MDKYKKKTLKFMGMGKEVRAVELNTARAASRNQRFSLRRPIEDEDETPKQKENASKIPKFGKPCTQEGSRIGMLQKWKQEKLIKKQKEMKIQKPTFKVGFIKHDPPPVLVTHADGDSKFSKTQNITRSQGTSFRVQTGVASNSTEVKGKNISRNQGYNFRTQTAAASHLKEVKAKDSRLQPSFNNKSRAPSNLSAKSKSVFTQPPIKKPEVGALSNKLPNKTAVVQPPIKKPEVGNFSHNKLPSKDSTKYSFHKKMPTTTGSAMAKGIGIKDPPAGISKPVNLRQQNKNNYQNSTTGLLKPVDRLQNKKIDQSSSMPKSNISRLPPMKPLQQQAPSRIGRGVLKPPGASVPVKQTSNVKKTEVGIRQNLPAKEPPKPALPAKKDNSKPTPDSENVIFQCELSYIEPVDAREKSFAPKDFLFCPPVELNSSLYLDNGPSAIFARMKGESERTSTPKQSILSSKSLSESSEGDGSAKSQIPNSSESSGKTKEDSLTCESKEMTDCKLSLNFRENTDDPSKIQEAETILPEICVSDCEPKLEAKDNSPESEKENYSPEEDFMPAKHFTFSLPNIVSTDEKLDSTYPLSATADDEVSVFLPLNVIPADKDQPKINVLEDKVSNSRFVTQRGEGDVPKRSFRSGKPPKNLERINESPEDSTPKSHKKISALAMDYTPRRSVRLAKMRKCSSMENLFDVERPSMLDTPEYGKPSSSARHTKLTYDFERLHLESANEALLEAPAARTSTRLSTTQTRKVSLLYTPPRKGSVLRKSIKGDLMSFSPTV